MPKSRETVVIKNLGPHAFACSLCDYKVGNELGLKLHKRMSHNTTKMPIVEVCSKCHKKLSNRREVNEHRILGKCYQVS